MSKKIVLVGAGSAQFGLGMLGDIFSSKKLTGSEITLLDINEKALQNVRDETVGFLKKHNLDFAIHTTLDRKAAFKGADHIILSIEAGDRFRLWEEDWKVPQQYGFKQVYGENGGPGGTFHALRILPPILEICRDAVEICPEAQIFCYSNPMTAITTTVHRAFPGIRFTGMCHEIASLERYIPSMLNKPYKDMELIAGGLNHFSCLLEAKDRKTGDDLYPAIMEKAYEFFSREPGYSDMLDYYKKTGEIIHTEGSKGRLQLGLEEGSAYEWADRNLFRFIMDTYNLLPITGDSHFGEYLSWAWEVVDNRGIMDFFDIYKVMLSAEGKAEIEMICKERFVPIAEGMIDNSGYLEPAVNIINNGLIADLPDWIAVEVPGIISKDGITGRKLDLPKGFTALLRNYTGAYDLLAEAVLNQSRDYVIQSLLANPVVNRARPLKEMVDRMISRQSPWLDYLK